MNRAIWIFSWILLLLGVLIYLSWAFLYDAWTDIGLYSISSVIIAFGILGILLAIVKKDENQ